MLDCTLLCHAVLANPDVFIVSEHVVEEVRVYLLEILEQLLHTIILCVPDSLLLNFLEESGQLVLEASALGVAAVDDVEQSSLVSLVLLQYIMFLRFFLAHGIILC